MNEYLHLRWTGEQRCEPLYKVGPYERNCYILHYILSGCGKIETDAGSWKAEQGQMFLIYKGETIAYQADKDTPWHYVWADFDGSAIGALLDKTGFSAQRRVSPKFEIQSTLPLFTDMRERFGDCAAELEGGAALLRLFAEIVRVFPSAERTESDCMAENAARLIRASFCDEHCRIERIASMLKVSRSQLFRLFKSKFSMNPKQYLYRLRIEQAKKLLAESDMTVAEVGYACGYGDPLYFSRQFKMNTGFSPKHYRNESVKKERL